jgi:hypothetical protein
MNDESREARIEKQLTEREQWQGEVPSARLKAMGAAWLDRSDASAKEITGRESIEAERVRQAARQSTIEAANRRAFEDECQRSGIDPGRGISPSLLRALAPAGNQTGSKGND